MTYLLDSNVWVALLRGTNPQVTSRFRAASSGDLRFCSVIVAELRYGCARSAKAAANRAAVDALLAPYPSLPFAAAAVDSFVSIRTHLESLGTPIGPYDLQNCRHRPDQRWHAGNAQPGRVLPRTGVTA